MWDRLQEIKTVDEGFPRLEIEELGYNVEAHGQKSYNGVALLSRFPIEDVVKGLPGNEDDDQAPERLRGRLCRSCPCLLRRGTALISSWAGPGSTATRPTSEGCNRSALPFAYQHRRDLGFAMVND